MYVWLTEILTSTFWFFSFEISIETEFSILIELSATASKKNISSLAHID